MSVDRIPCCSESGRSLMCPVIIDQAAVADDLALIIRQIPEGHRERSEFSVFYGVSADRVLFFADRFQYSGNKYVITVLEREISVRLLL